MIYSGERHLAVYNAVSFPELTLISDTVLPVDPLSTNSGLNYIRPIDSDTTMILLNATVNNGTAILMQDKEYIMNLNEINNDYFAYAPVGKIGVATQSARQNDEKVETVLFPKLYELTNQGQEE